jgi:hypothetical protein
VTILILEHACLFSPLLSISTQEVLDKAYLQYSSSNLYKAVVEKFPAHPKKYSLSEYIEFILKYHLF